MGREGVEEGLGGGGGRKGAGGRERDGLTKELGDPKRQTTEVKYLKG